MNDPTVTHNERQRRRSEIRGLHRPSIYTGSQKSTTCQLHPSAPHVTSDAVEWPGGDVRSALSPSSYSISDPDGLRTMCPPLQHRHTINISPHIGTDDALDPATDWLGHETLTCETKGEIEGVSSGHNIGNKDGNKDQHMPTQFGSHSQLANNKTIVNGNGGKQPAHTIKYENKSMDEVEEEEGGYFDDNSDSDYNIHSSTCSTGTGVRKVSTSVSAEDLATVVSELRAFQRQQARLTSLGHEDDDDDVLGDSSPHGQNTKTDQHRFIVGVGEATENINSSSYSKRSSESHNSDPSDQLIGISPDAAASYNADEILQIGCLTPQLHVKTRHKKRLAEQEVVLTKLLDASFLSPAHTPPHIVPTLPANDKTVSQVISLESVTNPPQTNSIVGSPPTERPPILRPDLEEEVEEVVIEDVINDVISNSNNNNSNITSNSNANHTPSRTHSIVNTDTGHTDDDDGSMHHILLQHKNSTRNIFTHIYDTFNCIPFIR